ncbi:CvpA family protein [Streptococcus porcinus]|uniref:Membrane protein n=1 Tax=Streptococcus porcinus TaxID=1340 RepID=A0A4V6M0U4_STRPO|nr:CvpA family protein [Streptococcus porcinus]VTT46357.1 membrane protein [Streptococcus porcinus]VTT47479.1 membrane protein [Streptococcus porcinus]
MVSLLILLILLWLFYIGFSRGIILQSFYFLGAVFSLFVAKNHYQSLARQLTLWIPYSNPTEGTKMAFFKDVNIFDLSKVYYAGIAFVFIFIVSYTLVRFIGIFVHFLPTVYLKDQRWQIVSGFMAVCVGIMVFSMLFSVLATIPLLSVQEQLSRHFLIKQLITQCPPMTSIIHYLWIDQVI